LVTLFAAGTGYGAGATSLATATTNASGDFNLPSYTCPVGNPQTYITASGGDAGSGTNSAIALMAALGPCNSLSTSTHITVNELTTAAAQWALAQFFDSTGHTIGAPSSNAGGLRNAYTGFANLAGLNGSNFSVSGNPSTFLPTGGSCPGPSNCDGLERLNTLANIMAGCIESSGSSSSACVKLMCDATPGLTYTTSCSGTPTISDTMGAAHLIVTNPANNVSALFGLAAVSTPFSPVLGAAPDGWEIALNFAPAGAAFSLPQSIALDASGNVFVANSNGNHGPDLGSVSELTVASGYAAGLNLAPAGAVFDEPTSLALDGSGDVFVANGGTNGDFGSVSELTVGSSYATGLNFAPTGTFRFPISIALDTSGNVFMANATGDNVSELTAASGYTTGLKFAPPGASFDFPQSLALDGSGNVFVANTDGDSVSELTAGSSYATGLNFAASGASFNAPASIALDGTSNVFVGNEGGNSMSELTAASSYATGLEFASAGASFNEPVSIALDGAGNVFAANANGESVSELTAASSYGTGLNFAPAGAGFSVPSSIAVDGAGNVFVADRVGDSVSEILGLAQPVITPVQSCLTFWSNHPGLTCVP
jgi:hypothetical protein